MRKAGITKWRHRRGILDISRFLLIMFLMYAIINGVGIMRFDIEGMHTFLKYFNGTVMIGIILVISFLDICKYNLLNYGRLFLK